MPELNFRFIEHGTREYEQECELRNQVLRIPLGLDLYEENLDHEDMQMHFGIFDENEELIACLVIKPLNESKVQLRQMVVNHPHQSKGIGRYLVENAEHHVAELGYQTIVLHARDIAIGFYRKIGYMPVEESFEKHGIPHQKMIKTIIPKSIE